VLIGGFTDASNDALHGDYTAAALGVGMTVVKPARLLKRGGRFAGEVADASNYKGRFLASRPDLPEGWIVHHSIPQRYEELFRTAGLNIQETQFLRGLSPQLHSRITTEWARFHQRLGNNPTAAQVADFAKHIDELFGGHFVWPGQ
jgi:hypothetical protein